MSGRGGVGAAWNLFTGIDSFKGPLDVGNANGNFGVRFGALPRGAHVLGSGWAWDFRPAWPPI